MIITSALKGETEIKYYYLIEVSTVKVKNLVISSRSPHTYLSPIELTPKLKKKII